MSNNALDRVNPAVPVPTHLGQATAIEQSRAAAEVQAAVVVAQQRPRHIPTADAEMRASCAQLGLAERAFYSYRRGKATVAGASVHLARELARCWGNVQYGIAELRRDDDAGFSEMQAYAWDMQTNTRSAQIFVVPHQRDKTTGAERLTDMRDIYENNANQGARRLREAIFSILPPWFVEDAKRLCHDTVRRGDGSPVAERATKAVGLFASMQITEDLLVQRVGRPRDKWTEHDVAKLGVTYQSIYRGEISRDDEFPTAKATAADVLNTIAPGQSTSDGEDWPDTAPAGGEQ